MGTVWQSGERVRIRTEDKTVKTWGRVVDVQVSTEMHDVPGRTSVRLIVELES